MMRYYRYFIFLFFILVSFLPLSTTHAFTIGRSLPINNLGLVGYWTFDGADNVAGRILDKSGNGNSGAPISIATSTFYAEGKIGQAVNFFGAQRVRFSSDFINTNPATVAAWIYVRTNGPSGFPSILDNRKFVFGLSSLGRVVVSSNAVTNAVTALNAVSSNKWYHVVATRDASGVANLYVNGTLNGSANQDSGTPAVGSLNLAIGDAYNGGRAFDGLIDDVRVYTRVLTASEIARLYGQTNTGKRGTSNRFDPKNGLVGWWTFDGADNVAGRILDKSGFGNHGNPLSIATSTFYAEGKMGQAGNFDGVNARVVTGSDFIGTNDITVSAWVKANSYGEGTLGKIIDNAKFLLRVRGPTTSFNVSNDNGGTLVNSAAGSVTLNRWQHVAVTRTSAGIVNIYVNGVLSGSANQNAGTPAAGATNVVIGNANAFNATFDGLIDDVRVYTRILTASEITQLYNLTSGTKLGVPNRFDPKTGLVGWWTFDGADNIAGRLLDKSGNGNTGYPISIATSTFYVEGKIGQAGNFNGVSQYVNTGIASSLQVTGEISICAWAKTSSTDKQTIISNRNATGGYYLDLFNTGTKSRFTYFNVQNWDSNSAYALSDGVWHQYCVVNPTSGTVKFYRDGVFHSTSGVAAAAGLANGTQPNVIGAFNNIGTLGTYFNGVLDDVRVYSRALSATEIGQLYNKTGGR